MNKNHIAILYEGEKTERQIFEAISEMFFAKEGNIIIIHMPLAQNIYMLWNKLKEDDFETDVIEIARESCDVARDALKGLTRDNFSQIFLFVDLDFHSASENLKKGVDPQECLREMVDTFSNETEEGKLYISYPMIESLKCYNETEICTAHCCYPYSKGKEFKNYAGINGAKIEFLKYTAEQWKQILCYTVKKANCIVMKEYLPATYNSFRENLTQKNILIAECDRHIPYDRVMLISGVPLFLLEYYRQDFYDANIAST